MEFPEGFSCRHSNPVRYIVRGASHPVISATVARPRRRLAGIRQVHVYYHSVTEITFPYNNIHIQSCDIVPQLTAKLCGANEAQRSLCPNERLVMCFCYIRE